MDDTGRPLTAKEKRQEQLRRWDNSATDSESAVLSNWKPKVKFNDGAVFLAACSSGDLSEVGKLLEKGADINFANIDGLTALHQACIDGNLDVVEYLVKQRIDIDQEDNEGWTPLHAAASCGYMDIARFLVKNGANVAAVNSEGEVPLDIAEEDDMMDYLQQEIKAQGLDLDAARNQEREVMTNDAEQYYNALLNGEKPPLYRHLKSGATALHVAAAKGYVDVIRILLKAGINPNLQDNDGWTPMHAASHWAQQEAAKLLSDKNADLKVRNKLGQTPSDVADEDMLDYLVDLRHQQEENKLNAKDDPLIDPPHSPIKTKKLDSGSYQVNSEDDRDSSSRLKGSFKSTEISSSSDDEEDSTSSSEVANSKSKLDSQKSNNIDHSRPPLNLSRTSSSDTVQTRQSAENQLTHSASGSNVSNSGIRRQTRPASLHFPSSVTQKDIRPSVMSANSVTTRPIATTQPIQKSSVQETPSTPTERNADIKEGAPDTWRSGLRKTGSFDEKKRVDRGSRLGARNQGETSQSTTLTSKSSDSYTHKKTDIRTARVAPILDAKAASRVKEKDTENLGYQRSSSYSRSGDSGVTPSFRRSFSYKKAVGRTTSNEFAASFLINRGAFASDDNDKTAATSKTADDAANSDAKSDKPDRRRSHLQPVRDEEAEAQRKARSRRERQSRRSTQGVTLDVYEEAKRQIENMKQERESSSGGGNVNKPADIKDGSNENFKIPHNDSVPLNLNRRHKDPHHLGSGHSTTTTTGAAHAAPVTLPSGYIPSDQRVKNPPSASVPSITVNDDLDNNGLDLDNDDEAQEKQLPAGQSPSAKKSAAQQRRRQRKERRSTGLPGLKPDSTLTDDSQSVEELVDEDCEESSNLALSEVLADDLAWLQKLGPVTKNVKSFIASQSSPSGVMLRNSKRRKSLYYKRRSVQGDLHPIELRRLVFGRKTMFSPLGDSPKEKASVSQNPVCSTGVSVSPKRRHSHCGLSPVLHNTKVLSDFSVEKVTSYISLVNSGHIKKDSTSKQDTPEYTKIQGIHLNPTWTMPIFQDTLINQHCLENSIQNINSSTIDLFKDRMAYGDNKLALNISPGILKGHYKKSLEQPSENCSLDTSPSRIETIKRKLDFSNLYTSAKNPPSDEEDDVMSNEATNADSDRLRTASARYETSSLPDRHNRHRSGGLRGSDSDLPGRFSSSVNNSTEEPTTNAKNYKKLYEEQCAENDSLGTELSEARRRIAELESRLERAEDSVARRKAQESERRERKALERKLADMEKELLSKDDEVSLQAKNLELKQENQALTRLVNKLGYPDALGAAPASDPTSASKTMVQAFSSRSSDKPKSRRNPLFSSVSEESEDSDSHADSDRKSSRTAKSIDEDAASSVSSSATAEPERRSSFTDKYSSSLSSLRSTSTKSDYSTKNEYSSYKDKPYKSDYTSSSSSSRYAPSSHTRTSSYTSERPYSIAGSLKERDRPSKISSSLSSPSLSSRYNTIPMGGSRSSQLTNSHPTGSSPIFGRKKIGSEQSRYAGREDFSSGGSSYRSRNYEPISRSRSPVSFPTSANSKRVGNLMDTYRLKP